MAILVKHNKVSTVPDDADTSLVRPSDWNADHTLTGFGTAAEKDAGVANGVATLDSGGKVPQSQIPLMGDLNYQGTWNATTNTPTLTSSVGTKGYYYVVDVAGSTNLNGITDWQVGDWAIFNGTVWQKVDNTDAVTSVNGQVGTVVLTTTNIAEGTNLYYTDARARASVSAGTGISYVSGTGVITNSAPDQTVVLNAGTGISTSGTYPNFTITNTSPSLGGNVVGPASATDNAIARFDTTTGKLIQNSVTTIDDTGNASGILSQQFSNGSAVTLAAGKFWYNGTTGSWNAGMGGGLVTQQIGEELYRYGKASATISDSPLQLIYKTGVVGASGVITFAPAVAGITRGDDILGCATEPIANNAFGRITTYGIVNNITTNGTAYGETWADNDDIYYNPATGGLTKTLPSAPNLKLLVGTVINAGSGGSGSFIVKLGVATYLRDLSDVQLASSTGGQFLTYNQTNGYWKNTSLSAGTAISVTPTAGGAITVANTGVTSAVAGTGISVSGATGAVTITNTAPDQTVSLTAGTGISVSGTYPSFTIANTGVTSVTGTSPIVSSGGATPAISIPQATGSVNGFLSSTDWTTFNSKGNGTVTSVSALTLGTTGTDLSSTVANGTTTPVITLNVPTASASNRGALSAADWTTFNSKANAFTYTTNYIPYGQGTTTPTQSANLTFNGTTLRATDITDASLTSGRVVYAGTGGNLVDSSSFTFDGTTQTAPIQRASNGIVTNNKTIGTSFTIPSTDNAMSSGPVTLSAGVTVTVSSGSRWVVL